MGSLPLLLLLSCSKLGPECERLAECCEALSEPVTRQGCLDTLEEHGTEDGAEAVCQATMSVFERAGSCEAKRSTTDGGNPASANCTALRRCCEEISSGPYRADCLVAVGQMELQRDPSSSCLLTLEGYVMDGWCELASSGKPEDTDLTCTDGVDNDGNGYVDCDDFGCSRNPNVSVCRSPEDSDAACRDGRDNDGDSFFDCDDYDCSRNPSVSVCG